MNPVTNSERVSHLGGKADDLIVLGYPDGDFGRSNEACPLVYLSSAAFPV
jgi:hypothetical protein